MTIVLLAVGLLVTAVGLVTIGFGIPINAFSLGNTLIVAGTVAVAGGLILIGLASAVAQLRRIAEALQAPHRAAAGAESTDPLSLPRGIAPAAAPASGRGPETELDAVRQAEVARAPELRVAEPPAPAPPAEPPGPLEWLRVKSKPAAPAGEPPVVEVPDEAPLSPRSPQRPPVSPPTEPTIEPKAWSPSRDGAPPQSGPAPRAEPPPRATPQPEPARDKDRFGFDLVWPDRSAPPPAQPPAPPPEASPPKREPALEMPIPPIPARPREGRAPPDKRPESAPPLTARKPAAERAPAILKSGVIDGMPYTLYADGSIEAQLPQGTVKFASVDALRAHLEKQG